MKVDWKTPVRYTQRIQPAIPRLKLEDVEGDAVRFLSCARELGLWRDPSRYNPKKAIRGR